MSKVIWSISLLAGLLASPLADAQSINSVRVFSEPSGAYFTVDGQNVLSQATYLWPAGSRHVITAADQAIVPGTSYVFKGYTTNLSGNVSNTQPITADPSLQWVKLLFDVAYTLDLMLPDCVNPLPCTSFGTVEIVGHGTFTNHTKLQVNANAQVEARAFPNDNYIFTGWSGGLGTAFDIKFTMTAPMQLVPNFSPATTVGIGVSISTYPPQLQVLLDRTPYIPPVTLQWGLGTVHSIGANPLQIANGVTYVFDSWSDGGAINHDIVIPSTTTQLSFTAKFVEPHFVTFATSPPGLGVSIDGRTNWPNYIFPWAPGSKHTISAPATQTDAQGHKYRFVSWSNNQPAVFDYVAGPAPGGSTITAVYQAVGQATVSSVPPGIALQVDGADCTTPCALEKDAGVSVKITAPATLNLSDQSRLMFAGWGDSSQNSRVIQLTADAKTYTVTYSTQNRLLLAATPADGAAFTTVPASADGFYDAGSAVSITSKPGLGFRVNRWTGDISATTATVGVTLNGPITAVLILDRVPAVAPLGVRNAAAGASADSIAPGSLISIFGANLAADLAVGPATPLPQILENVTVRVDDAFLPLAFVSPTQINAQLPAALTEGSHKITIRWEGKPETSATATVTRNAPGLFNNGQMDQPIGLFLRADGTAVTPDHPASAGETISLLGTGLGPYAQQPPDGFLVDENSGYTLVDAVELLVSDSDVNTLYAGRSGAAVGTDAVRFQVPTASDSSLLPVRIRINGKDSNVVFLPVGPVKQE